MSKHLVPLPTYEAVDIGLKVFRLKLKLYTATIGAIIGAFGGFILFGNIDKLAWLFPPTGLVASAYGLMVYRELERKEELLESLPAWTLSSKTQRLKEFIGAGNYLLPPEGLMSSGLDSKVKSLTPDLIKSFPHLLILAPTGWGKTTLLNHLINQIDNDIIIIDPHCELDQWGDLPVIFDLEEAAQFLLSTYREMRRRYSLRQKGIKQWDRLTIVVDEFPVLSGSDECSEPFPGDKKKRSIFLYWFQKMLFEARKVDIQLCLLSQGKSVKSLQLEGQSELLENLKIIRGGEFAEPHAKSLKDDTLYQWVKSQERPAMLNDYPLLIPDLSTERLRNRSPISPDNLALIPDRSPVPATNQPPTSQPTINPILESLERSLILEYEPPTNHQPATNQPQNIPEKQDKPTNQPTCPNCLSDQLIGYGKRANRQRYQCKDCKKIFTQ